MKEKGIFRDMGKPFLVLVCICLAAAALLGVAHYFTEPVIRANAAEKAEETRKLVLPEAEGFEELDASAYENVESAFVDKGGAGYVITASATGYKGDVVVTVGFNADGEVVGIDADVSTETMGVGTRAGHIDYVSRYLHLQGTADSVDTLTGATYSSSAVRRAVNAAMAACEAIRG